MHKTGFPPKRGRVDGSGRVRARGMKRFGHKRTEQGFIGCRVYGSGFSV